MRGIVFGSHQKRRPPMSEEAVQVWTLIGIIGTVLAVAWTYAELIARGWLPAPGP